MKTGSVISAVARHEKWLALLLALLVFISALSTVNYDCDWGDDFAAYMNQGIAMVQGRFREQIQFNAFMHPSQLPEEAANSELVYAWGYSLVLAGVYNLAGFDRSDFHSVLYYKLPSVLALALLALVLYYFFRRRFGMGLSAFLSLLLCMSPQLKELIFYLYSDIVFFLFSWLCFSLSETLAGEGKKSSGLILRGLALGLCLWAAYVTRLNGFTVVLVAVFLQLKSLLPRRRSLDSGTIAANILPYLVLALLTLVFNHLVFAPATSNLSDLERSSLSLVLGNIRSYIKFVAYSLLDLLNIEAHSPQRHPLFLLMAVLLVYGFCRAWKKELIYLAFTALTFFTLILLPYTQGPRYFLNVMPVFMFLLGYALEGLYSLAQRLLKSLSAGSLRYASGTAALMLVLYLFCSTWSADFLHCLQGQDVRGEGNYTAYSAPALEAYRYIQENTEPEAVIAFIKPRSLYLNTGRLSFRVDMNGHDWSEADYYLCRNYNDIELPLELWESGLLNMVWTNKDFTLFSVEPQS